MVHVTVPGYRDTRGLFTLLDSVCEGCGKAVPDIESLGLARGRGFIASEVTLKFQHSQSPVKPKSTSKTWRDHRNTVADYCSKPLEISTVRWPGIVACL